MTKTKLEKVIFRYELYHSQTNKICIHGITIRRRNKQNTHEKRQGSLPDFNPLLREDVRRLILYDS